MSLRGLGCLLGALFGFVTPPARAEGPTTIEM
jgi:hypothetical protein